MRGERAAWRFASLAFRDQKGTRVRYYRVKVGCRLTHLVRGQTFPSHAGCLEGRRIGHSNIDLGSTTKLKTWLQAYHCDTIAQAAQHLLCHVSFGRPTRQTWRRSLATKCGSATRFCDRLETCICATMYPGGYLVAEPDIEMRKPLILFIMNVLDEDHVSGHKRQQWLECGVSN